MSKSKKHVLMVAAENGALRGGKVGGVADVVKNLSAALADQGGKVTIITPSYGFLHETNAVIGESEITFPFGGREESARVYQVASEPEEKNVRHLVVENIWIRGNPIYTHDSGYRPFASDAAKYALFCSAVGRLVLAKDKLLGPVDVLHLHDWHAATLLLLRRTHVAFAELQSYRTAFTIHNIAIQGTRPIEGDESSLFAWFPEMGLDPAIRGQIFMHFADQRYNMPCYSPMAVGVALADAVTTVSPGYAEEILTPSDHSRGYFGGEGMEWIVRSASDKGRLFGILNGIDYPKGYKSPKLPFAKLRDKLENELNHRTAALPDDPAGEGRAAALFRLAEWKGKRAKAVVTYVGRICDQKVRLLLERGSDGSLGLAKVLGKIDAADGVFIMLGVGLPHIEKTLTEAMKTHPNFLYIPEYSDEMASRLYAGGHIHLMPSLYEPCGLSQMLAMRDGQPPLVNDVGGLKDTVRDGENGFLFRGADLMEKVDSMTWTLESVLDLMNRKKKEWSRIRENARATRFTWDDAAERYARDAYQLD